MNNFRTEAIKLALGDLIQLGGLVLKDTFSPCLKKKARQNLWIWNKYVLLKHQEAQGTIWCKFSQCRYVKLIILGFPFKIHVVRVGPRVTFDLDSLRFNGRYTYSVQTLEKKVVRTFGGFGNCKGFKKKKPLENKNLSKKFFVFVVFI